MPEGFGNNLEPDSNEVLLAELRFSDPDRLPALIQNNINLLDDDFYLYLEAQISKSPDIQERDLLRDLRDAITDVMKQIMDASEAAQNESQAAASAPKNQTLDVTSTQATDVAEATYDELIDMIASANNSADPSFLKIAVDTSYHRIDLRLLERLNERISKEPEATVLAAVRDVISATMNERVSEAAESVKAVLSAGHPDAMRKEINTLARNGKIDDAFILLIQANMDQASQAGADQAFKVLEMVRDHASSLRDITVEPEVRLIRTLLRTEDSEARVSMLTESLKPRGSVTLVDGTETAGVKVDGKKFVTALRKLIEEFGNVDEKFILKLSQIGEESEAVARKIMDMEDKTVQDLQDEAFHKRSVSVWDLERIEMEEKMEGRDAAWEGRLGVIPEGFDADGKMQV